MFAFEKAVRCFIMFAFEKAALNKTVITSTQRASEHVLSAVIKYFCET
jgi:hypothetical protein